jgi:hypothetical protein
VLVMPVKFWAERLKALMRVEKLISSSAGAVAWAQAALLKKHKATSFSTRMVDSSLKSLEFRLRFFAQTVHRHPQNRAKSAHVLLTFHAPKSKLAANKNGGWFRCR